jgi:hypothetical protein
VSIVSETELPQAEGVDQEAAEVSQGRFWVRRARVVMATMLVVVGAFIVPEGIRLGFVTANQDGTNALGPGFFPVLVGGLLSIVGSLWGVLEWRTPLDKQKPQDLDPKGYLRVINIGASVTAFALMFEPLGFVFSVFAFLLYSAFTYRLGSEKSPWWMNVVVALVARVGIKIAFEKGLGVMLSASPIPALAMLGL